MWSRNQEPQEREYPSTNPPKEFVRKEQKKKERGVARGWRGDLNTTVLTQL